MKIDDVIWLPVQHVSDDRGCLTAIEGGQHLPFEIKRVFFMHQVARGADRGGHAHRDTDQFAMAVHGSVRITVADGTLARTVKLDNPRWGIYLPRMTWTRLFEFSEEAVCLVLASTHYDRSRSVRTWQDYLTARGLPGLPGLPEPISGQVFPQPQG